MLKGFQVEESRKTERQPLFHVLSGKNLATSGLRTGPVPPTSVGQCGHVTCCYSVSEVEGWGGRGLGRPVHEMSCTGRGLQAYRTGMCQ